MYNKNIYANIFYYNNSEDKNLNQTQPVDK